MKKLRLVVADDHPLVLAGARDLLGQDIRFEITGFVSNSTELVKHIKAQQPDVAVTDFSMPGDEEHGDGLRLMTYLTRHFPDTRILVITMMKNPLIVSSLYKSGASGVVLKSDPPDTLIKALECLRMGRKFLRPNMMENASGRADAVPAALATSLSPKELEVLRHFVNGESLKDIAQGLSRSLKTVSAQKRTGMRKLQVSTDQELIAFCTRNQLFE